MVDILRKIESAIQRKISGDGRAASFPGLLYTLVESFFDDEISLRAASLVYTTLLTIVPFLAVIFSVLKAFGVDTQLEITLHNFLEPLGEKGAEISLSVMRFVENMNVAVLGAVGLSSLLYTVISTVGKIEAALNSIWHVRGTRPLSQKFSVYLSIVLLGPVLGFSAIGLMVSLKSAYVVHKLLAIPGAGSLVYVAGEVSPYFLVCITFTLVYILLPNTRIRIISALTGGCFAAVGWGVLSWAFTSFIVSSSHYSAVYSGLAALFLFIVWIYWNWLVMLAGARVACCHQHPAYFSSRRAAFITGFSIERSTLRVVALIAANFYGGGKPLDADALSDRLGIPVKSLEPVLQALVLGGIFSMTAGDRHAYLPAKDPSAITLKEVVGAVRSMRSEVSHQIDRSPAALEIETVLKSMEDAVNRSLEEATVKDLVQVLQK